MKQLSATNRTCFILLLAILLTSCDHGASDTFFNKDPFLFELKAMGYEANDIPWIYSKGYGLSSNEGDTVIYYYLNFDGEIVGKSFQISHTIDSLQGLNFFLSKISYKEVNRMSTSEVEVIDDKGERYVIGGGRKSSVLYKMNDAKINIGKRHDRDGQQFFKILMDAEVLKIR